MSVWRFELGQTSRWTWLLERLSDAGVLDRAHPVTDPGRPQPPQDLVDARRPVALARVRGEGHAALGGPLEGGDVRVEREAELVAGEVQPRDQAAAERLGQPCRLHAPRGAEVAQRAEQHADLDARRGDRLGGRALDD